MDLTQDSPCIIGSSCRLPGGVLHTDSVWSVFNQGDWSICSTLPPPSREFSSFFPAHSTHGSIPGRGGWLGEEGIECFDAEFFKISNSEATTIRPNVRLALELTYEALENAGIPPSSLRGKNVSVSIGIGTEDGWDLKRWKDDGPSAFDHNWAASSDPSGVPGRISHAFDFRGSCNTVSNACASGAFALRDGINSLYREGAEIAIVGSLATHFAPAPFEWACSAGVISKRGRSSAFSPDADGYSPSEGAVFFVLKRHSAALSSGDDIRGVIRALASGHNGTTRTLMTPNAAAQAALIRNALAAGGLEPSDVTLLEAHGTGTPVGDALEAEVIRSIFGARNDDPLFISSSKTIFGHCHSAAALVGVLKVLSCFERRIAPSHHVKPHSEFLEGPIIIPVEPTSLKTDRLIGQVNAFGFTGSIATIILEHPTPSSAHSSQPTSPPHSPLACARYFLLPFSAKSSTALSAQIRAICSWALETQCSVRDLATVLGLCRDHHTHRCAVIASVREDIVNLYAASSPYAMSFSTEARFSGLSDDRITLEWLDIEHIDVEAFDDNVQGGPLRKLVDDGRILEAACLLYERGHTHDFSLIYDKRDIDSKLLRSFPLYSFDRRRYWRESSSHIVVRQSPHVNMDGVPCTNSNPPVASNYQAISESQTPRHAFNQENFEELISTFGAPSDIPSTGKAIGDQSRTNFLLTGANGMLGAQLLSRLLDMPCSTIYCIVRGDPWDRLRTSFTKHQLNVQLLNDARSRGSLHLFRTEDLCARKLGLMDADYDILVESVDEIIHSAWNVNFNLPLVEFLPFLRCTRILAELCFAAKKLVRYHFIGSYASTFNFTGDLVPECPLIPRLADSLAQGYAISKLVAEHSLMRIHNTRPTSFQLVIIRVGQICGNTVTGAWAQDEMIPMIIKSLPTLRALPAYFPNVAWIPSDVCADSLRDFVTSCRMDETASGVQILHLANPQILAWSKVAVQIGEIAGVGSPELLPFQDYVDLIRRHDDPLPVSRLLPYFVNSLEEGTMPQSYASLEVSETLKFSSSLASCPPIQGGLLDIIVRTILNRDKTAIAAPPPVFLFGPWSSNVPLENTPLNPIEARIMDIAKQAQSSLGDAEEVSDTILEQQLKTLASQLTTVHTLLDRGVVPNKVLGYCFGEYAAAITAGIHSEETVVNILVRRAMVLRNITGAMLNVFCEAPIARRSLSSIASPPNIAIIAGPKHIVLSGSHSQITCAQAEFHRRSVKTVLVPTTLPFHSALMDEPARNFAPFNYSPHDSVVSYISGVTGKVLLGSKLGPKYWLRHLRDPVDFYSSMQCVRATFAGEQIVDIGPDAVLTKITSRYGWPDKYSVITADECGTVSGGLRGIRRPPLASVATLPRPKFLTSASLDTVNPIGVALGLLRELFGYDSSPDLLSQSLHSVGLQSMDFIRFADHFRAQTGINITLSAFVSDAPLETIIREANRASESVM